ncbi:hypothetical protein FITA111629_14005 [Filibacter tadaridae]|uniref:Uncharacterized protein n=1 Tax=Filibacter tadaridae TaxID=2483811 RepID=A0A3P5X0K0_9BACL|nr:hypothetical protein [Filibacter tadaridae]VDC27597.1 hypothetical protein FILTAD_01687 [Filibacter tadaridae]
MYYPNDIEEVCYEPDHMKQVSEEIKKQFDRYFKLYLETEAASKITAEKLIGIAEAVGSTQTPKIKKVTDQGEMYKSIVKEAINNFEKDRDSYLEIMDDEALEEHEEDPPNFKSTVLKNTCPIIRVTLQNKRAKELDKYRAEFRRSDPNKLLSVVTNLSNFATEYIENNYDKETYEDIQSLDELGFSPLDTSEYTAFGVIGGGIKSHLVYKTNPAVFPNRSRDAIWALWYLTGKKTFDCHEDSEFLMIDTEKNITQQNFFYPYELFSFYALQTYRMMKEEAGNLDVYLNPDYRYVFVESFLSFVAHMHNEEINFLKSKFREDGYGFH